MHKTTQLLSLICFAALLCGCDSNQTTEPGRVDSGQNTTETTATFSLEKAVAEIASGDAVLIDVREQNEWDEKHFEGAILIPKSTFSAEAAELKDIDKTQLIYTHCAKGKRAEAVAALLKEAGYNAIPLELSFEEIETAGVERSE